MKIPPMILRVATAAVVLCCLALSVHQAAEAATTYTVSISIKRAALASGQKQILTATTNDPAGVSWAASGGSISPSATLSGAPMTFTAPSGQRQLRSKLSARRIRR